MKLAKKFTTRVKNRSQARLHRRQTSSNSSRLVRIVGEGGAKRDTRQNGNGVAREASGETHPGALHLGAHQEVLFILFFRRIHIDFKNYFVDCCFEMYSMLFAEAELGTRYFKSNDDIVTRYRFSVLLKRIVFS